MDIPAAELADLVLRTARRLRAAHTVELEDLPVNPHQARALTVVARLGPVRPSALADRLHVAARSATEVVDFLVAGEWVARAPDPDDRRALLLSLSPKGWALLAQVEAARARGAEAVLAVLDARERGLLARILSRTASESSPEPGAATDASPPRG